MQVCKYVRTVLPTTNFGRIFGGMNTQMISHKLTLTRKAIDKQSRITYLFLEIEYEDCGQNFPTREKLTVTQELCQKTSVNVNVRPILAENGRRTHQAGYVLRCFQTHKN